jgi:hypothetical protein
LVGGRNLTICPSFCELLGNGTQSRNLFRF